MWQLRQLQLTDLHDGRLHVGDQVIPLAPPVRKRLTAYLDYRQQTWPNSVNPHLFIHARSATTTRPVTLWWIRHQLGISGQQIRLDRILDEAHATGGDIRRRSGPETAGRAVKAIESLNRAGLLTGASTADRFEVSPATTPAGRTVHRSCRYRV